jgi:hypothetical protein
MQILDDDKIMQALLIKIEDLTNDVHCLKRTIIKVRTSQEQPKNSTPLCMIKTSQAQSKFT